MNRSTPGLPVHHQLPDSTQTHVPCVSDAIQPSHTLLSPSPPAFSLNPASGSFLSFFFFLMYSFYLSFFKIYFNWKLITLELSQLFASGGQSIAVSASTSVPPMNTQD